MNFVICFKFALNSLFFFFLFILIYRLKFRYVEFTNELELKIIIRHSLGRSRREHHRHRRE